MIDIVKDILLHSCHGKTHIKNVSELLPERRYFTDDVKFKFFKALPVKCTCKKWLSKSEADSYLMEGKALVIYRPGINGVIDDCHIDQKHIIALASKSQTPRVDLNTKADMERAYDDMSQKFYKGGLECLGEEIQNNSYYVLIEARQEMMLEERAKWIVPEIKDPQEGRLLFPFGPDQRTFGGHS